MTPEVLSHADDATLKALSDLCMRSKAHWGYDAEFMLACRDVLRIHQSDLTGPLAVIRAEDGFAGMVQLALDEEPAKLSRLFVDPAYMGRGVGTALIQWAKAFAREKGHRWVFVESDPDALNFYVAHGAEQVGTAPSEAIPGRMLPLLKLPTSP